MKLFPPESHVDLYNVGFGKDDELDRAVTGQTLSSLVEKIEDPLVIAIDGGWGTGKTYFLKRWVGAHTLENGGSATTIYFDAFAHDFLEDPLIALTGAISDRLPQDSKNETWQKVKLAAAKLARPATRIGLALATYGATEIAGAAADVLLQAGSEEAKKATDEFWRREDGRREAMLQLKVALQALTKKGAAEDAKPTPIVIVIDELDRCRPDYALATLETIKHFFAVPNIHFVLGVNLQALQQSVRARYGVGIDGEQYLRRFVNLTLRLSETINKKDRSIQMEYFERTSEKMGIDAKVREVFLRHVKMRLRVEAIPIRDIGRILTRIVLLHDEPKFERLMWGWQELIASLVLFNAIDETLYQKAVSGKISRNDVWRFFGITEGLVANDDGNRAEKFDHPSYIVDGIWRVIASNGTDDFPDRAQFCRAFDQFGDLRQAANLPRSASRDFLERFAISDS